MNYASDGGGGGGGGSLIVDHGTLNDVVAGLGAAGEDLDAAGSSAPGVAVVTAAVAEAGARVAFEAKTLSAVVGECNDVAVSADQAAAESYLVSGK